MASRVLGLLRESLLAYYFDRRITDAWGAAYRVPNVFRRLFGEGALAVSFVPVFVEAELDSTKRAQNLVNSLYSFLLVFLGCFTALGVIYPEFLLGHILDVAYIQDHEKFLLTLRWARIMFSFVFFISSYAFTAGILNSLGHFFWPALAPTFLNICVVIFILWPQHDFSLQGDQLAIGILLGGAIQFLILVPALYKSGYLPKLSFDYRNRDFLKVMRNMLPGLIGGGLLQFTTLVNLHFASSLPEGTISHINYIDRLIELPLSLVSVSLGSALLPALSGLLAKNEKQAFGKTARSYLELNLMITMSAAAGLFVLAQPIVQLLFGRGHFLAEDVVATADILKIYCWIMIFMSGVRVLAPAYYAVKNTWLPAIASGVSLGVHIIMAPYLIAHSGVLGLMLSTTLSAVLNLALLLACFIFFVTDFKFGVFFKNIFIYAGLAVAISFIARLYGILILYLPAGEEFQFLSLFASILTSIVSFLLAGYVFKIPGFDELIRKVPATFRTRNSALK